ncbi:MAG: pyruvate ferredoxin oxidoreductase, partial [Candidatus Bathyarchaeota archaeon]
FVGIREIALVKDHKEALVPFKLDPENPLTMGPLALYDYYFELKRQQEEAMKRALKLIKRVHDEYAEMSGRRYGNGLIDPYCMEDAEIAAICVGSTAGTTKTIVDELRADGVKAGLLRLRTYRPSPKQDIIRALKSVEAVAVMDRSHSFGAHGGPVFHEIRHILYDSKTRPQVVDYIYGLGGRDMPPHLIHQIYKDLEEIVSTKRVRDPVQFIGVRE